MHPDEHLMESMKAALIRASDELGRATARVYRLRAMTRRTPPTDLAAAAAASAQVTEAEVLEIAAAARAAIDEAHAALRAVSSEAEMPRR